MLKRAALCALYLLVACAAVLPAADTPGDPKIREFVIADIPQKLSLDPLHTFTSFESQFYTAIYEGLVVADPLTLEPVPGVASELAVQRQRHHLEVHPPPRRRVLERRQGARPGFRGLPGCA